MSLLKTIIISNDFEIKSVREVMSVDVYSCEHGNLQKGFN